MACFPNEGQFLTSYKKKIKGFLRLSVTAIDMGTVLLDTDYTQTSESLRFIPTVASYDHRFGHCANIPTLIEVSFEISADILIFCNKLPTLIEVTCKISTDILILENKILL